MDVREAAEAISEGINCLAEIVKSDRTTALDASRRRLLEEMGEALVRVGGGEFETTLVVSPALKSAVTRLKRMVACEGHGEESFDELHLLAGQVLAELGMKPTGWRPPSERGTDSARGENDGS